MEIFWDSQGEYPMWNVTTKDSWKYVINEDILK